MIEFRAAVAWAVGEPLTIETVQVAVPLTGEVRIKIVASGVCHTDLFFQRGGDGPDAFPCILGHEGAGIVESVGPNVTSVEQGYFIYLNGNDIKLKEQSITIRRSRNPGLYSSVLQL